MNQPAAVADFTRATINLSAILAAAAAIIAITSLVLLSRNGETAITTYVAVLTLGTLAVFLSLWRSKLLSAKAVIGIAVLLHIIAIFGVAIFEDDYFRFIWDGWRLTLSGSPYGIAPSTFFGETLPKDEMALVLDGINNPKLPTIYGPTLQFIFALAYICAGTDPIGLRVFFAALNLILIALLLRTTSPEKVALYAWCPVVVAEIVIHIHPDAIMAMLLIAGILSARRYPIVAGIFFGFAAGAKIVALALWPALLRIGWRAIASAAGILVFLYSIFLIQGYGAGFGTTGVFASAWYFNPIGFALLEALLPSALTRPAAAMIGVGIILLLHARSRSFATVPVAAIFGAILLFAPAVNNWYLLWILPFATKDRNIWPYAATIALPLSYFTGLNLDSNEIGDFEVHPFAWAAQIGILLSAICYDYIRNFISRRKTKDSDPALTPILKPKIAVIIPALNEEASIGDVIRAIKRQNWQTEPYVIVADNGSTDNTAKKAIAAGAQVIQEPQRGYGAACLAGISAVPDDTNILLFMDGDGADVPEEAGNLIAPLVNGTAELVIGSRALGQRQSGSMTIPQQFGNWLATNLIWLIWNKRMHDLGPFRAIRRDALCRLQMADRDFGWTIEMQVKAVQQNMRIIEQPADYRRRIGVSKISGTINGVFHAGAKILYVIGREAFIR